jgi:hypothetical protein
LPYGKQGLVLTHGEYTTAKAELETYLQPGISGHLHRQEYSGLRFRNEWLEWSTNPCLCTLEPHWKTHPDWVNGFMVLEFFPEVNYLSRDTVLVEHEADESRIRWRRFELSSSVGGLP